MAYAGFWKRFGATLIDGIILMIPTLLFTGIIKSIFVTYGSSFLLSFLYRPFFESSSLCGTPGKALVGIAVVNANGEQITFKQACLRFFCTYLSGAILMIGYLIQPFTEKRQTLHDILSQTYVIHKVASAELNYFVAWKNKFQEVVASL